MDIAEFKADMALLQEDIRKSINSHSIEFYVGLPDFIIAEFMVRNFESLVITNSQMLQHTVKPAEDNNNAG